MSIERKMRRAKRDKRRRICSIDDPRLDADAREYLRAALTIFARDLFKKNPDLESEEKAIASVIRLFEFGYLQISDVGNGVEIGLGLPKDAPQLNSSLAMVEQ
jgi:hypothetical protein